MAVEIEIAETLAREDLHASRIKKYIEDGWEIISHHVVPFEGSLLYTTMLKRDLSKRLDDSNLLEAVRRNGKHIEKLEARLKVVETTLDDDAAPDDRAYSLLDRIQIVEEAILEDEERGL